MSGAINPDDRVEVPTIMRALDPEVFDSVWAAIEPLIPVIVDTHPLGCHRVRAANRGCFDVMLVRLATGCAWETPNASAETGCLIQRCAYDATNGSKPVSLTPSPPKQ